MHCYWFALHLLYWILSTLTPPISFFLLIRQDPLNWCSHKTLFLIPCFYGVQVLLALLQVSPKAGGNLLPTLLAPPRVGHPLSPVISSSLPHAGEASGSATLLTSPWLWSSHFFSRVTPDCSIILNRIHLPWLFWASFYLILLASSPSGVWGTNRGTLKPSLLYQFIFLDSLFFCLKSSSHDLGLFTGLPPPISLFSGCLIDCRPTLLQYSKWYLWNWEPNLYTELKLRYEQLMVPWKKWVSFTF